MQQLRSKVQSTQKSETTSKALPSKKAIKEENNIDVGEEELQLDQIKVRFKRRRRNVADKIHKQRL